MSPILGAVGLAGAFAMFSDVEAAGYGGLFALEILVEVGLLVFLVYAATQFFAQKSNAPSAIITLMVANLVASAAILAMEAGAGLEDVAAASGVQLAQAAVAAGIWIPYFRMSKRMKATFVN